MGDSETEQLAGADAAISLPLPELTTIVNELTARARANGADLQLRTSPIHAMVELAKKRPDVGSDVIAAILGIPYEALPPSAAVLLASLAANEKLKEAAIGGLRRLTSQDSNPSLKSAAEARLQNLQKRPITAARRP
jgi:hypothetical protein